MAVRLTALIPTYNRAATLPRAIDSVLAQSFTDFRLLISDNASSDETQAICERYAAADPRVTYHRQAENLGPIGNFNSLFGSADTELLVMLADDDWFDLDYFESAIAMLDADPTLAIVTGLNHYEGDTKQDPRPATELLSNSSDQRVMRYLRHSWSNHAFYGVMRTAAVRPALPIPNVLGADWLFVAGVAFAGRVATDREINYNCTRGGASANFERMAAVAGLPHRAARYPHLAIAANQFRDIAFDSSAYRSRGRARRVALGLGAAAAIIVGHPFEVFWDVVGPLVLHRRLIRATGPLRDAWHARHADD
ncbi:MAG TPA: glycosyltransferase family 2 protein [Solirubrobacteraceae bacterium]|jgi:glycosyltransferase involved in cell wall biosynthesis